MAVAVTTKEDEHIASRASKSVRSREADFEKARLHSGKVRLLKWVLPIVGIGVGLVFAGYAFLSRVPQLTYDIASTAFADGKLVMSNPKLDGVTKDNLPYSLRADRATQDPLAQSVIELEGINAKVPIDAKDTATVVAAHGIYNSSANTLDIDTPLSIEGTNGLTARLTTAHLEIDAGKMTTPDPVEITLNGNRITADTFSVLDNGKILVFEKRVRLNIIPAQGAAEQSGEQNVAN
jgi:lipopolysaccharide export system protein LptC